MIVVLAGYPGSQKIVKASKYLTSKYLTGFDITYLNYKGEINKWSTFLQGYLTAIPDEYVIFALDDYLLADHIDMNLFNEYALAQKEQVACIKLCKSTPEEHIEYPVTTQYCIWNREYLISLLQKVENPWEFETKGSRIFETDGKRCLLVTCLDYFANSSISSRWEGVRLDGLKEEDKNYLYENRLI